MTPIILATISYLYWARTHLKNCTNAIIRPPKAAVPIWNLRTIAYDLKTMPLVILADLSPGGQKYLVVGSAVCQYKVWYSISTNQYTQVRLLKWGGNVVDLYWIGWMMTHHLAQEMAIIRDPMPAMKFIVHSRQKVRNQSCSPACIAIRFSGSMWE